MKKKVLVLSHLFPNQEHPHYGIFVLNRLLNLCDYCEIKVVAPVPRFPFMEKIKMYRRYPFIPRKEQIQGIQVEHPFFPIIPRYFKWLDSFSYFFSSFITIYKIRKNFDFELIDVNWTYPDILTGFIWSWLTKKEYIVSIRGNEALYPGEKGGRKYILDKLLKRAGAIITLSQQLKELVLDIGIPENKVHVVLDGVEKENFFMMERFLCRQKLNLVQDKKIVVSIGSLILTKGHQYLIKALPLLSKKFSIELYIIGDVNAAGDDAFIIEKLIKELGLNNVHLVGSKPFHELILWYNAADLFCLASEGEGCPNVVLESLACGTPVVATDVGAISDLIGTDAKGYVVPKGDQVKLEEAMHKALIREWDREAIHESMQTWDDCAKQVVLIYNHQISGVGNGIN